LPAALPACRCCRCWILLRFAFCVFCLRLPLDTCLRVLPFSYLRVLPPACVCGSLVSLTSPAPLPACRSCRFAAKRWVARACRARLRFPAVCHSRAWNTLPFTSAPLLPRSFSSFASCRVFCLRLRLCHLPALGAYARLLPFTRHRCTFVFLYAPPPRAACLCRLFCLPFTCAVAWTLRFFVAACGCRACCRSMLRGAPFGFSLSCAWVPAFRYTACLSATVALAPPPALPLPRFLPFLPAVALPACLHRF